MSNTLDSRLKKMVLAELSNITTLDEKIISYMSNGDNWILVNPDGYIGSDSPLCYPMEILSLSVSNMPEDVKIILGVDKIKPIEEELSESKIEALEDLADSKGLEPEDFFATGFSAIIACFYWDSEEVSTMDLISEDRDKLHNPERVFIFNGYDINSESEHLGKQCLNSLEAIKYE